MQKKWFSRGIPRIVHQGLADKISNRKKINRISGNSISVKFCVATTINLILIGQHLSAIHTHSTVQPWYVRLHL
jgi:hypothetical protein